jgi:hypothetical protein
VIDTLDKALTYCRENSDYIVNEAVAGAAHATGVVATYARYKATPTSRQYIATFIAAVRHLDNMRDMDKANADHHSKDWEDLKAEFAKAGAYGSYRFDPTYTYGSTWT